MKRNDEDFSHDRSYLFVPADRLSRLSKALASGAHCVIVDLEDAVAPADKCLARDSFAETWQQFDPANHSRVVVRINATDTPWHTDDLALLSQLAATGLTSVMVPKAESATALQAVASEAPSLALLPLIESAQGLRSLDLLAQVHRVRQFAFGHLDFQADLGMHCEGNEEELNSVRLAIVIASRLAGLRPPIDGVTTAVDDQSRLIADTQRSRRFGFGGKLCIHPRQIEVVNQTLCPTNEELEWAKHVLAESSLQKAGAFKYGGQMIDAPVLQRAKNLLSR